MTYEMMKDYFGSGRRPWTAEEREAYIRLNHIRDFLSREHYSFVRGWETEADKEAYALLQGLIRAQENA